MTQDLRKNLISFIILAKLVNLTKIMNTYTLKLFNTGQVTLPKEWRKKHGTKNFIATETPEGLLIQPLEKKKVVYFEKKDGFGLYAEEGLPVDEIVDKIKKIHGSN